MRVPRIRCLLFVSLAVWSGLQQLRLRASPTLPYQGSLLLFSSPASSLRRRPRLRSRTLARPACVTRRGLGDPAQSTAADGLPEAVVINLARRSDRWTEVSARLSSLGVGFSRLEATDGKVDAIADGTVGKWWCHGSVPRGRPLDDHYMDADIDAVVGNDYCQVKLTPGERGCVSSHIRAWQQFLSQEPDESQPLLVFEDDVVPDENSIATIRSAVRVLRDEPPGVLYLGWGHWVDWKGFVTAVTDDAAVDAYRILQAEYPCTTHAYVIWPRAARLMLQRLPVDCPMDHFMAKACSDGTINSYCVLEGAEEPHEGPWGGVVRQHRQDNPDTESCGIHPAEVLLQHQLKQQNPDMFKMVAHQFPVPLENLRIRCMT
eukprot:TRINITY_DN65836_c0_g1_i1.p1 TRINITY_DN65836_c0_g1~~TRINITY_DN65836_c0_g1_i1.p1  ORF type:complete len:375 (+),score=61.61 TRINITY_DN65836_c0_g1_i1:289-1413(+)